jgi:hypothetical protein
MGQTSTRHATRLVGTPETVCCHQTAVFIQNLQLRRSVSMDLMSGLAVCCARTDRPRRVSSLEACVSLGISDLINLTLPAYMYLSHPSNSSTKLSTSLLPASPATNFSLLVCPAKLVVYTWHKPFETLCRTGRGMAMASVLSAQGARSGVPARLAHASTG